MTTLAALLDGFQLTDIKTEKEVELAYAQLFFNTPEKLERKRLTTIYKEIKKKIRTRPPKGGTFITIKENCNNCVNVRLSNGLKIPSGTITIPCSKCKIHPGTCRKCNNTGILTVKCPRCKGTGQVTLKRRINVLL